MVSPSKSFLHSMKNEKLRRAALKPILMVVALVLTVIVGLDVWVRPRRMVTGESPTVGERPSAFPQYSVDPSLPLPSRMSANLRIMTTTSNQSEKADQAPLWPTTKEMQHMSYSPDEQVAVLNHFGTNCLANPTDARNMVLERYFTLPPQYQSKLFQYCMLYQGYGNAHVDVSNVAFLQDPQTLLHLNKNKNIAIRIPGAKERTLIHEAFLYIPNPNSKVMLQMVQLLLETSNYDLAQDSDLLERALGSLILGEESLWTLWQSHCPSIQREEPEAAFSSIPASCPMVHGYCCHVSFTEGGSRHDAEPILALRHPLRATPVTALSDQSHFYSTVTENVLVDENETPLPTRTETPNFFDILFRNDCLPTQRECHRCLKLKNHCRHCYEECPCYCKALCRIRPPPKMTTREFVVRPPQYRRDAQRLIPKLIHQTWYEPVTPEKYPNMSRLMESWKQSGWKYTFYDDLSAAEFLSEHFPTQVREAYESIIPGAFKADLFRYCVLLIRGGIYSDMDVLLESNLELAISPDVGFLTPQDEPGTAIGARSCLWNGLLAVAPGHPFLAKTIELVVNNVRNRFTSVDYDDMLCPNPQLSVSHSVDTLFTCGPCILGAGINTVLRRHKQAEFEVGDVDIWKTTNEDTESEMWMQEVVSSRRDLTTAEPPKWLEDPRHLIPGRTIILEQNKQDMGAHRFTWADRNLMVAATDMPDYDDRPPTKEHYSKSHEKFGVYGLKKLYTNQERANEYIRIVVEPAALAS